ncbi:MAG: 23S rRNA (uracil(1939)-C(5))-methyltransferase RlmD [Lachnospiraceae bacterium]|nr:23S rRNA (uracil(1939)-C(5))-methyltransferase RlmD [Lachnospiraceae bacterium]
MERTYKKDDILKVTIEDISDDGLGIGKADGYALFVKDTVVGDECIVKIMKAKKNYAFAHLEEVTKPSSFRISPKCEKAKACGGCQLQALSYEKQLEFKETRVKNNLVRIGGFDKEFIDSISEPIIANDNPFRYRNKAQYPIAWDKKTNAPIAGFYAGHTHSVIPVKDCLLGPEEFSEIMSIILDFIKSEKIPVYSAEEKRKGIRHVLLRKGFTTGEIMVCLVLSEESVLKDKDKLISLLKDKNVTSLSVSINPRDTNVIMGDNYKTIYGKDTITDYIGDLKFNISPLSFFQVNPVQTKKLYAKALEYASLSGEEAVWDLYCGIGTISLFLAKDAKNVYGVEIIPQAIDDARENAQINDIENAEFFVGKAEEVIDRIWSEQRDNHDSGSDGYRMTHPDVIVVDPPRKGCDELCLSTMLKMQPDRIVYVSCDSATLARDLKILCEGGYELKKICACDMFSQSVHVETVVLLGDKRVDGHIKIDVDVEKLDNTGGRATYAEIKDYIKEKYGYSISSLYIAQMKDKAGLDKRENYNHGLGKDSRVPQCTPEKEEAIMDAFRHFKMI